MNARLPRTFPSYWKQIPSDITSSFLTCTAIPSSVGGELICYQAGKESAEPLLIVPPLHVPAAALVRVIEALSVHYLVTTYEVRGSAFLGPDNAGFALPRVEKLVADLSDVYNEFGRPLRLFGWCNGAKVIAQAVRTGVIAPDRISLLAPSGIAGTDPQTTPSVFGAADGLTDLEVSRARKLFQLSIKSTATLSRDDELMNAVFGLNFDTAEKFRAFVAAKLKRNTSQNYENSENFAALFKRTRVLLILPEEDYFVVSAEVHEAVRDIASVRTYDLANAGHAPVFSHSDEIAFATYSFFS
ncbi:alpha/beta fold hydrolase [Methylobacter luteus]|uniref:alpha/beta fold hydrolase n=1 Tax=Methylobacter luteus TaxID=415 RepID=UPI0004099425|nr:alpha/beta hydrolase [Methylobacter luteus]